MGFLCSSFFGIFELCCVLWQSHFLAVLQHQHLSTSFKWINTAWYLERVDNLARIKSRNNVALINIFKKLFVFIVFMLFKKTKQK